ncbi:MAG: hypothetical protein ABW048_03290, partial [Sphingobium sp.]
IAAIAILGLCVPTLPASAQAPALPPQAAKHEHADAPVDCRLVRMALPPELADWGNRTAATAAPDAGHLNKATLVPGRAVDATLLPAVTLRYALPPEKKGDAASFGGLFALTVVRTGTYRVALGSGVWVDLIRSRKALPSLAHGHGRPCTGVAKYVDFRLQPGRYVVQLAASAEKRVAVMVAPLP